MGAAEKIGMIPLKTKYRMDNHIYAGFIIEYIHVAYKYLEHEDVVGTVYAYTVINQSIRMLLGFFRYDFYN